MLPVIEIGLAAASPAFRQIADAVRAHLVDGRVSPGRQLPLEPSRGLAPGRRRR